MRLNFITVMVNNLEQSTAFYRELAGLQLLRRIKLDAGEIAFLANQEGETMLELIEFAGAETVQAQGMVLSFSADSPLEVLRERALALGYAPSEIIANPPKPVYFKVTDPDGIAVEFGVSPSPS